MKDLLLHCYSWQERVILSHEIVCKYALDKYIDIGKGKQKLSETWIGQLLIKQ